MSRFLTMHQVQELLILQAETNVLYMGENWREVWNDNAVCQSIYREYAEFLDETERDWHCYKKDTAFNKVYAVYELVDIAHFMLTLLLLRNQKANEWLSKTDLCNHEYDMDLSDCSNARVRQRFSSFMVSPNLVTLVSFLQTACTYLGITPDTYMLAHHRKNQRNRLRAAGGVMEGKYDKSLETPLTLEF